MHLVTKETVSVKNLPKENKNQCKLWKVILFCLTVYITVLVALNPFPMFMYWHVAKLNIQRHLMDVQHKQS